MILITFVGALIGAALNELPIIGPALRRLTALK